MNFLFDMDGVLVNSEPVILKSSIEVLRRHGVNAVKADFQPFIGAGEDRFIGGVAQKHGLAYHVSLKAEVYELYLTLVDEMLGLYPSTLPMLKKLKADGHTLALASSADQIKIDANLKTAKIDPQIFSAIISGDDVELKKPHPDIYLAAAKAIGAKPEDCIVVEDALNGIEAAHAAGMKCIAVTTSFKREQLSDADFIIDDTSEITDLNL